MNPTHKRLAEIKQRCEAATPGPWYNYKGKNFIESEADVIAEMHSDRHTADVAFICKARTDIPCLLEVLEIALEALCAHMLKENSEALARIERIMGGG